MTDIIIIIGPTAIGKSDLAVEIAKSIDGEIISADSMQIYKGMDIGTGKITEKEKFNIPHHLIDIVSPNEIFSVDQYVKEADNCIATISAKNKIPIITGGTGLYINALINGHDFGNVAPNMQLRNRYLSLAQENGNEYIYNLLKKIDNSSAEKISINDTKRIIRALEIYETTGKPKSQAVSACNYRYSYKLFILDKERKILYDKINSRVESMFKNGLLEEVQALYKFKDFQSMQAIGYKETILFLENKIDYSTLVDTVKQNSRRYAKRQLTYFRWFNAINKNWLTENYKNSILNMLK